uniref:Pentatricopeptide repeat-containing protein n=1 Tax=Ananas comosus var. bracteatus TaxID=296719 RepID=A0A6V7QTJ7_ANACO
MLRTCSPDKFTFPLALKACAHLSAVDEGEQIHSMIVKSEFIPTNDVHVSTSLKRMYALCGRIDAAQQLFDKMPNRNVVSWNTLLDGFVKSGDIDSAYEVFDAMPERNVVSWNSMIAGFVKNDLPREALMLFIEMMVCGLVPDEYTMASVISAISDLGLLDLDLMPPVILSYPSLSPSPSPHPLSTYRSSASLRANKFADTHFATKATLNGATISSNSSTKVTKPTHILSLLTPTRAPALWTTRASCSTKCPKGILEHGLY